jgi:RimJ/RimL family protein N-acetyltransferase
VLIKTGRFLLQEFTKEDTSAFAAYHRDARYVALYGPEEAEVGHAADLVATFIAWRLERPRSNYQLAVCLRADATLIGCVGLRQKGCRAGEAELGIELAPDYWGRYRYAVEITEALLDLGFQHLHLKRIFGVTISPNRAIHGLAEWFGASVVETHAGPEWMQLRGWKQVVWEITPSTWKRVPPVRGAKRGVCG